MTESTGNLPTGWATAALAEIGTVITGNTPPTNDKSNYGGCVPFVKPTQLQNGMIGSTEETLSQKGAQFSRLVPANAVMVSCIGNLGRVGIVVNESAFNQQINAVVFSPAVYPRYGFYACQCLRPYLESVSSATTIAIVNKAKFSEALIPIAPLPEQRRIVARIEELLSQIDAGVDGLRALQKKLRRYRAAVLKAACEGTLVPIEAELARAENRDYEPASDLLARVLAERRARWEADQLAKMRARGAEPKDDKWKARYEEPVAPDTSDLPELPDGWSWASLRQVSEIQGGIQKQPSRIPKANPYPFLRVANVHRGRLQLGEIHSIELFDGELERLRLEIGDLLIVEGNGSPSEIGRMAIWNGLIADCVHQNHIIRARPLCLSPAYVATYWNSTVGTANVLAMASSTSGLHTLSVAKVGTVAIPTPPLAEQTRIVAEVERRLSVLDQMEATLRDNLKRADRLRQAVLRDAFAGKLVPQDPDDEPAADLLARVRAECAEQTATTARKKADNSAPRRPRSASSKSTAAKEPEHASRLRQNDAAGAEVPSRIARRVRDARKGPQVQPDLFSRDGA